MNVLANLVYLALTLASAILLGSYLAFKPRMTMVATMVYLLISTAIDIASLAVFNMVSFSISLIVTVLTLRDLISLLSVIDKLTKQKARQG